MSKLSNLSNVSNLSTVIQSYSHTVKMDVFFFADTGIKYIYHVLKSIDDRWMMLNDDDNDVDGMLLCIVTVKQLRHAVLKAN